MKLPFQIMLYFAGFGLLFGLLSVFGTGRTLETFITDRELKQGSLISQIIVKSISRDTINGDIIPARDTLKSLVDKHDLIHYAFITDFDGRLFAHTFPGQFPAQLAELKDISGGRYLTLAPQGIKILQDSYPLIPGMEARLNVGLNQTGNLSFIKNVKTRIVEISAVVALFGLAIAYVFCRRICRPLEKLTNHIRAYGRGELQEKVTIDKRTLEVSQLANEFNQMIDQRGKAEELSLRLGRIMDQSFNEIFIFDAETYRFIQVNQGALNNLGYSMEEMTHLTAQGIKPKVTPEQFDNMVEPLRTGEKQMIVFETVHKRKDSTMYPVEVRLQLMHDENPPIFVAVIQDITLRKKAEQELENHRNHLEHLVNERTAELKETSEQLLHSEKLAATGKLAASFAHEFNNPLYGVTNVLEEVKDGVTMDTDYQNLVDIGIKESHRMAGLIRNLQDFHRPTSGMLIPFNIHEAIHDMTLLLGKKLSQRNVDLEMNLADDMPKIAAVPDQIKQVVLNILQNAEEATPDRGTITVSTEVRDSTIKLHIRDTGPGISPENIKKVFDPFFTTKSAVKGTGLGLSISHGIIKTHGGNIDIQSAPGEGTTMSITLPIYRNGHEDT